jgi:hydroxymethylbilane synthase
VARAIEAIGDEPNAELVPIATSGDEVKDRSSADGVSRVTQDKSRFVKEIEEALLRGDVDLAVHSAKDVPAELPQGLEIVAAPPAEDARDALVGGSGSVDDLPEGARVGTSSLRRRSQLFAIRPDLEVLDMRGNVDTRLRKLADGDYDAIVLALAGLRRLGRDGEAGAVLEVDDFVPAAGQGILVLEARTDDADVARVAEKLGDEVATARLRAERAVVKALGTSCYTPVGVHARTVDAGLRLDAYVGLPDGSEWIRDRVEGGEDAEALGTKLAERMLAAGAGEILRRAEAA